MNYSVLIILISVIAAIIAVPQLVANYRYTIKQKKASLVCKHEEHDPPAALYFDIGIHYHQCPGCKRNLKVVITRMPYMVASKGTAETPQS